MEIDVDTILDTSRDSFKFFMHAMLGFQNPDFLNNLDDVLSDPLYKKIVAAYPRGHGKSTHLSVGYPLWKIAQNHNLRILIVSNTSNVAQGFLRGMLNQIEDNPRFIQFAQYCDPMGVGIKPKMSKLTRMAERWSSTAITIDRDDLSLKDPTIQAIGLFGSIISKRADIIIADDIVDQKNSATEEQRQKIKDWFYTTLLPILIPGGQVIYLGNTWHANDLVSDLLKDPMFDYRQKLKSIISEAENQELWNDWARIRLDEGKEPKERTTLAEYFYQQNKAEMDKGVHVLWPDRLPYSELFLMRLSNSYSFARMYQCDPSSRPDQKFEESWFERAKEKGANLKLQDEVRSDFTMDLTTAGIDLAISLKDTADDTVLLTLDRVKFGNDVIRPGDFILRNIRRGKYTPNEVRTMVKTCNDFVRPLGIRVESVAYQESMVRDLWDMGQVNVRGHKTGGEKNDIEIGINSLAILMENGKLVLPYDKSDPRTVSLVDKLVDEMRSWPEGHTGDSLMALWFAYLEARDLTGKRFVIPAGGSMNNSTLPQTPSALNGGIATEEYKADMALITESNEKRQRENKGFVF